MKFYLKSKDPKHNSKNFKVLFQKYFHSSNPENLTLYNNRLLQLSNTNKKKPSFIFNCFCIKRKNKSLTAKRFLSNFDKKVNKIFFKKMNQNLALTSSEKIWLNFLKIKKQQFSNSFLKLFDTYRRFDRCLFDRKNLGQFEKIVSLNSTKNSIPSELKVPIHFIQTSFSSFKLLNIFCLIEFFSIQNQKKIYYNKLFFFKMNFFQIQKKSLDSWSNFYYICITFWSTNLLSLLTNRVQNSQFPKITIKFSYILFKIRQLLKKFLLQYALVPNLETKYIVNDCFYMLGQSIYDCLEYIYQNFQQYQKFVLKINNLINIFSLNIFQYSINCFSLNDLTNQFRKKFSFLNRYLFLFNTENFFSKTLKFQYLSFNENINMKTKNESLQKTSVFLKMKKQKKKNRTYLITEKLDPKNKKTKLNSMFNKTFFYDVTFVHFFQLKYIQKTILWLFLKNCSKNSIRWSQFLPSPLPFAKPLVSTIDRYPCHRYICQSVIFITNKQIKFSLFRNKTQKPLKYKILSFFSKKTKNFENKTQNGKKKKVSKKYWKKRLSIKCFCFIYNPLKFESKHFLLSRKIKLRNEITLFHFKEKNKDNVKFSCLFFEKEKEGIKFFGTESSKGQTKDFSILKKNHLKIQNGLFSISKIQCENIFLSISPNYEILFKFFNSICYWFQKYGIFCSFFTLKNSISGLDLAGFYITQKKKTNKKIPVFLDIPESFYQTFFSDSLSFETFSSKEFHSCFSFFLQKKKRRNKVYILFKQFLTDCIKNLSDQKKQLNANLLIEKKKFSQFLPLFFQNKTFLKNNKENFQQSFFPFYKQFNKNFINSNKIVPSKLNFKNYLNKIQFFIQMSKSKSQTKLIQQLSPLITMWCFYYKTISQKKILNLCDQIISQAIWRWACRKHANKSKGWVRHKYYWSYNINKAEKLIQKKRQNNDLIYNLSPSSKKLMTLEKKSFDFVNEFSSKLSNNNTTLSQFHLQKKKSNSRIWEFCTYNSLQQSFYCLPKHKNTKLVRHLKRFQHSSLYDKNWKYWINRCHLTGPNILPEL